MPIKRRRSATGSEKAAQQAADLRGWPTIAHFLGMPISTVHRWGKEGMPVQRQGRNVVATPEALNRWLQRSTGEGVGVHVATVDSDLLRDLRASVAAQKGAGKVTPKHGGDRVKRGAGKKRSGKIR